MLTFNNIYKVSHWKESYSKQAHSSFCLYNSFYTLEYINKSFSWAHSNEGSDYWSSIFKLLITLHKSSVNYIDSL